MAQIIRSGAFLQQCWSVHPLCVQVKRMTDDRILVLTCTSCKFAHYLSLGLVASKESAAHPAPAPAPGGAVDRGALQLMACAGQHQASLTLRDMDVFQDLVRLRCAECRRQYDVTVASFETHQR
jgi:ribosomal protein L44E